MPRREQLAHFLHGALSGFLSIKYLPVSILLYTQFFLYEYFEETKIKDEMYRELKEWSGGFITGLLSYFALRIFSATYSLGLLL